MASNQNKSPIGLLAGALAAMTERACEAERQMDAAKEDAKNWYEAYQRRDEKVKELEAQLAAEKAEHKKTRESLQLVLSESAPMQKARR